MEPDTDAANIGPEASTMAPVEAQSAPKMPRRRIVGRRTVAEKTATRAAQDDEETTKTSEALIGISVLLVSQFLWKLIAHSLPTHSSSPRPSQYTRHHPQRP